MIEDSQMVEQKRNTGDVAVEGLFAGFGAGLAMALVLIVAGLLSGRSLSMVMSQFAGGDQASPLTGALTHLAVAGVYGALFGVLHCWLWQRWLPRRFTWLVGLAYGLLLWLIAYTVLRAGIDAPMHAIPTLNLALAHLIYGLSLGLIFGRNRSL
jgi:hypothetical protein